MCREGRGREKAYMTVGPSYVRISATPSLLATTSSAPPPNSCREGAGLRREQGPLKATWAYRSCRSCQAPMARIGQASTPSCSRIRFRHLLGGSDQAHKSCGLPIAQKVAAITLGDVRMNIGHIQNRQFVLGCIELPLDGVLICLAWPQWWSRVSLQRLELLFHHNQHSIESDGGGMDQLRCVSAFVRSGAWLGLHKCALSPGPRISAGE